MISKRIQAVGIRRVVAGALGAIWLGVNAIGFYYVSLEHKLVERTIVTATSEHGRAWAARCADALAENDTASLARWVELIVAGQGVRRVWVTDSLGKVLVDTHPESIGASPGPGHVSVLETEPDVVEEHPGPGGFFHESGHNFDFDFPIERDGTRLGTLGVRINTAWGNLQAKSLAVKGLLTLLFVTIGLALIAWWIDRQLVRGVRRLTDAVEGIADGRFDQRVQLGTGDELDVLGDSVTRMAKTLRQSEQRVRHWRNQLEQTVAQRTHELKESESRLAHQEKMASLGLMAAGVAHEVGNPLTAISTIIQRVEWNAAPKLREKCGLVRQQIERISKIVDELRQLAHPTQSTDDAQTDVNEALRVSLQVSRYDPRGKHVKIVTDLDPNLPKTRGTTDRWQQVFLNLIINAFDAMPRGGQLTVISRHRDECVELVFRDTGEGINPEQMRKLFQPFYSTKSGKALSGLGLSVSEGIVRSCGGDIQVESEPGRGAEFRIVIPAVDSKTDLGSLSPKASDGVPQDIIARRP